MKKFVSIFLTLMIVVSAVSFCFAETDIQDEETPAGQTATDVVYDEETTTVDDDDIPAGTSGSSQDTVDIEEAEVPLAGSLPKTGGVAAELFYGAGGLFVAAAIVLTLTRKKSA